jgi:hypothetical protein
MGVAVNLEWISVLHVGTAFGLFGLSHLATLLSLTKTLNIELIVIRTLA